MLEVREKMSSEQQATAPFPVSFDRDLENARVLIEESPWKENPQKYRKVAEGIVRRVLTFDASNEYAKQLLDKVMEIPIPAPVPAPAPMPVPVPVAVPAAAREPAPVAAPAPIPPPKPQPVPVVVAAPALVVPAPTFVPAPTRVIELSMPAPTAPPPPRRSSGQMDLPFVVD